MNTDGPLVYVTGLGKACGRRPLVRNVTLRLARGEIVGLVGANGGGKTATLRMLARPIRPDEGGGAVLGRDLRERNAPRGAIGYMPQRLSLYPELTVGRELAFPRRWPRPRQHRSPDRRCARSVGAGRFRQYPVRAAFGRLGTTRAIRRDDAARAGAAAARRADRGPRHCDAQSHLERVDRPRSGRLRYRDQHARSGRSRTLPGDPPLCRWHCARADRSDGTARAKRHGTLEAAVAALASETP